jgi:hypothetical protein
MNVLMLSVVLAASPELKATMKGNLSAVVALQPLLASPSAFRDPANAPTITSSLATLARMKHQFLRPATQEPAAAIAELFAESVRRAQTDFASGQADPARMRLRGLTGLCLSCHSRQISAADFAAAGRAAEGASLQPLERAGFLAATRQFDAALALWGDALSVPRQTDADAFEQLQALRAALSVAIRAKDDASTTVSLLRGQCERGDQPTWRRRACERQLADARAWEAEHFSAATATPAQLYERACALIEASGAAEGLLARDEERVKLQRATAYLSLGLERDPKAKWRGEALYRLGVATGATLDPELWELDSLYLEACVRENPHSALGQRCIERLSERTLLDYTGSGGTRLPPEVAEHLEQLRQLAK